MPAYRYAGAKQMLAWGARLEQLFGDAPGAGVAEYLVGPGPGGAPPRDEYRPGSTRDVVRPSRRVGVRDRYAGVLGAADGVRASPGTVPLSGGIAPRGRFPGQLDVGVPERVRRGCRDVYPSPACTGVSSGTSAAWAGGSPPGSPCGARSANGVEGAALPGAQWVLGSRSPPGLSVSP